jgi:PilZ domain
MAWKERVSDRRAGMRFEIVGRLRGSLATLEPLKVRNIGRGGALIEAPWSLTHDSVHTVRLASDEQLSMFQARVCHIKPAEDMLGRFLIGLEFLGVDQPILDEIETLAKPIDTTH